MDALSLSQYICSIFVPKHSSHIPVLPPEGSGDRHTLQNTSFPKIYTFPCDWNLVNIYHRHNFCTFSFPFWLKKVSFLTRTDSMLSIFAGKIMIFKLFLAKKVHKISSRYNVSTFTANCYKLYSEGEHFTVKCKNCTSEIAFCNQS